MQQMLGQYHDLLKNSLSRLTYPLSFLSDSHSNVDEWQRAARAEIQRLMAYEPPETPLDAKIHDEYEKDGLLYQHVSYAQPFGPRTEGIIMRPTGSTGKLPGIVAMHDHGGFKYYGKEKITSTKNHPPIMKWYQDNYYGGRAWASELALRGYVVFVPDLFLWGSRKIRVEDMPEWYVKMYHNENTGAYWLDEPIKPSFDAPIDSLEYLTAYNNLASTQEAIIAKSLFEGGTSFAGIVVAEDKRAVDFLLTMPDVDAENIGCGVLSGGGLRTVLLAAMDERVKCSVCVGYMSTSEDFALYKSYTHTWMMDIPCLTNIMDFTDLYSLHGKKPTMVLFDEDDPLYTPKGQHDSNDRLTKIYKKMGVPEMYRGHFFPGPHKFDVEMQEVAFTFYDEWMKK